MANKEAARVETTSTPAPVESEEPKDGADLLRDIADKLRSGSFNLYEIAGQLDGLALGLKIVYQEMHDTDLRALQRKAGAWDRMRTLIGDLDSYEHKE